MTIETIDFAHISGIADGVGTLDVHIDYAQDEGLKKIAQSDEESSSL
ncbi:hypothetical protein [Pedobacter mendelii]|nr:hypothetical protein [Pedobacter mendelii]